MIHLHSPFVWHTLPLSLLLLFSACHSVKKPTPKEGIPNIEVTTPVVRSLLLKKEYPGFLTAEQTASLVARIDGTLEQINFESGGDVQTGDLLFVVEPTVYREELKKAQASQASASAQLAYARNNYRRMAQAAKSNAVSQIELSRAQSAEQQAEASLASAKADVATARTNLGYCYIRAPFSGHISRSLIDEGNYLSGEVSPVQLATLYKDDKVYAYFNIEDSRYVQLLKSGMIDTLFVTQGGVEVSLSDPSASPLPAVLDYTAPSVELSTGTMNMRAVVENGDGNLSNGLFVTVSIPYNYIGQAVLVHNASIASDQLGKYLYVVNDSNRVEYRPIEVGEVVDDSLRLVLNGLQPNERYVTQALLKVRSGMEVKPLLKTTHSK